MILSEIFQAIRSLKREMCSSNDITRHARFHTLIKNAKMGETSFISITL